jgi:hypothetical protein
VFDRQAARTTAVRLRVQGRVSDPFSVRRQLADVGGGGLKVDADERVAFVHTVESYVRAEHDLARLAALDDPVGVAAQTILELRDPSSPVRPELLAAARRRLEPVARRAAFRDLNLGASDPGATDHDGSDRRDLDEDRLAARLERVALHVLDELASSREAGDA